MIIRMYKKLSITRGDEMKDQRGSVTVMSLAMLLFLMVVAVAWLPRLIIGNSRLGMLLKPAIKELWLRYQTKIMTGDGLHRKNIFEIVIVRILRI